MHAGVPSVSVPVLFDQLWHGRRTEELGIGRLARHGAKRPAELHDAITAVVADDGYTERARAFGARLGEEDGVGNACDEVEDVLAGL
jgi:UDP:flavonoid glycosyltransferase YjiC (YdhE family)